MCGGMAQVWAMNETNVVLSGTSTIRALNVLLSYIEMAFGDPDQERMACTQLYTLIMITGITAEESKAKFEMLADRTRFNNATLEDTYVQCLPHSILLKVYSQTTFPSRLSSWKM